MTEENCHAIGTHVHKYVRDGMPNCYYSCKNDLKDIYTKNDEYLYVDKDELSRQMFEVENRLFRIDENEEFIRGIPETKWDKEYQLCYQSPDGKLIDAGVINEPNLPPFEDSVKFTGLVRDVTFSYRAYKIVYDKDGKMIKVPSDYYDSFDNIPSEYEYICIYDFVETTKSEFYFLDKIDSKQRKLKK